MTDGALGEAVGQDWVKQNFPPAAKASMDQLVAALEKSLGDDIKTLPWMSDETKKAAEEKLAMIRNKIGYPEKWRDYSALKVKRDDLIGNLHRDAVFSAQLQPQQAGQAGGREGVGHDAAHRQRLLQRLQRTTSTSPPASCSRPSSTSPSTPPSTSAASAS